MATATYAKPEDFSRVEPAWPAQLRGRGEVVLELASGLGFGGVEHRQMRLVGGCLETDGVSDLNLVLVHISLDKLIAK